MAVAELGIDQCAFAAGLDFRGGKIVQNHVHACETGGGAIFFLAFKRDALAGFGGNFQQERAGAAGGIVGGGAGHGVFGRDANDLGDDAADLGRRVELALSKAVSRPSREWLKCAITNVRHSSNEGARFAPAGRARRLPEDRCFIAGK